MKILRPILLVLFAMALSSCAAFKGPTKYKDYRYTVKREHGNKHIMTFSPAIKKGEEVVGAMVHAIETSYGKNQLKSEVPKRKRKLFILKAKKGSFAFLVVKDKSGGTKQLIYWRRKK